MKEYIVIKSVSSSAREGDSAIRPIEKEAHIEVSDGCKSYDEAKDALIFDAKTVFGHLSRSSVDSITIDSFLTQNGEESGLTENTTADIEIHPGESADSLKTIHYEIKERESASFLVVEAVFGYNDLGDNRIAYRGPFPTFYDALDALKGLAESEKKGKKVDPNFPEDWADMATSDGTMNYSFLADDGLTYCFYITRL